MERGRAGSVEDGISKRPPLLPVKAAAAVVLKVLAGWALAEALAGANKRDPNTVGRETRLTGRERTACVAGAAVAPSIAGSGRGPEPGSRGEAVECAMPGDRR